MVIRRGHGASGCGRFKVLPQHLLVMYERSCSFDNSSSAPDLRQTKPECFRRRGITCNKGQKEHVGRIMDIKGEINESSTNQNTRSKLKNRKVTGRHTTPTSVLPLLS